MQVKQEEVEKTALSLLWLGKWLYPHLHLAKPLQSTCHTERRRTNSEEREVSIHDCVRLRLGEVRWSNGSREFVVLKLIGFHTNQFS